MEIWKDVEGYEGLYQVSNEGRVKALKKNVVGKGRNQYDDEHIIKQQTLRGYKRVGLSNNNDTKFKQVHRLVAEAFIDNPEGKQQVDHINCKRDDNRVENLRWTTPKENNQNPLTKAKHIGKLVNREDLSKRVRQYTVDGKLIRIYNSISETRNYGFSFGCVARCASGERKTHKGFRWVYDEDRD